MLSDEYVNVIAAYDIAKKGRIEYPFHRTFSVDYKGLVRYKTKLVGDWDGEKFNLLAPYTYLKELLEEYKHEHLRA